MLYITIANLLQKAALPGIKSILGNAGQDLYHGCGKTSHEQTHHIVVGGILSWKLLAIPFHRIIQSGVYISFQHAHACLIITDSTRNFHHLLVYDISAVPHARGFVIVFNNRGYLGELLLICGYISFLGHL